MVLSSAARWLEPSSDHFMTYRHFMVWIVKGADLSQNTGTNAFGFALM